MTAWALGTLLVFAFGAGRLLLRLMGGERETGVESVALSMAAGLGLTALVLATLGLAGHLAWSRAILPVGAIVLLAACTKDIRALGAHDWPRPATGTWLVAGMTAAAALGALAPATEYDSLAYPIPIAQHLIEDDAWRFWPDQVRSVFPLSQEFLLVPLLLTGTSALGLVSAVELAIAAALIAGLARRVSRRPNTPWMAATVALGCPAVAFLAASAKEDLLLLVMTMAAAVSLVSAPGAGAAARVGLFAGFAAGAKLTGVPVALATIACVPLCCGRPRPVRHLVVAAVVAVLAGGLWPAVNWARFGNPLPLLSLGPWFSPPLISPDVMADWANGFGHGRSVLDFVRAPLSMSIGSELFGGRGNWINPLAFLGVVAIVLRGLRREMWVLVAIALAGYMAWFLEIQVARLLLPALALASVPAADLFARASERSRAARLAIGIVLVASAGVVAAVGAMRFERYVREPATFLTRETPHFDAITWMNAHLNLSRGTDRVASSYEANGYLKIPWFSLNATYQIAIRPEEMADPATFRAALERERVTHLFGPPDAFAILGPALELVYENPASRVGGSSFFRTPRTEPTAIYRVK